ncbi:MAG: carbohydrate ABC transporter permease [Treponema sp.]|jgi:putative aldouronate transport system permease protein|nr:carbohydrate ABC transporter permease [Treponema sp.]
MVKQKVWNYGKKSAASHIFDTFNVLFLLFLVLITLYPFLYVTFASVSDPVRFMGHSGPLLHPLGFQLNVYKLVFQNPAIRNGYMVTLFVVIVGTVCNMAASLLFAYVLSRKGLVLHGLFTFLAVFTMYFSGGMIPTFLVVKGVGLLDSLWSLIVPGLIGTYYVILIRTALSAIPAEMEESAKLDGAGNIRILVSILIPLIVPTIAAISLFYMVGHWNSWTSALIYIRTAQKFPLQLVLRSILLQNEVNSTLTGSDMMAVDASRNYAMRMIIKYCVIMVTTVPILCVYPFLQRHFTKGIMIGALKG